MNSLKQSLDIRPNHGLGPFAFGMSISEVRQVAGGSPFQFRKSDAMAYEIDAFENRSLHIYYRRPGVCEAIEAFFPLVVKLDGRELLNQPFSVVAPWLLSLDPDAQIHKAGLKSFRLGLALSAPAVKAPDEAVEAVLVFEPGYFTFKS